MKTHLVLSAFMKAEGIILYYFDNMGADKRMRLISSHPAYSVIP